MSSTINLCLNDFLVVNIYFRSLSVKTLLKTKPNVVYRIFVFFQQVLQEKPQQVWNIHSSMSNFCQKDLPGQELWTIVWARGVRVVKLSPKNTLSFELAMSSSSWRSTVIPMPREYTWTFLDLSPLDATLSFVYGPKCFVCANEVMTNAIYKRDNQVNKYNCKL